MRTAFLFGMMRKFRNRWWQWLHNVVNLPNAIDCTLKCGYIYPSLLSISTNMHEGWTPETSKSCSKVGKGEWVLCSF